MLYDYSHKKVDIFFRVDLRINYMMHLPGEFLHFVIIVNIAELCFSYMMYLCL